MDDLSLYLNWVLRAVYGQMAEADLIQRRHPSAITGVARVLRRKFGAPMRPVYRGVLLAGPALRAEPNLAWLSWSEDRDVARWFGSPASYISGPFRDHYPEARGYVLTLERAPCVLWHHSWRNVFGGVPLEQLALRHPEMGHEGCRQIAWSLDTQAEVITVAPPLAALPVPESVDSIPGAPLDELDRRLTPSWVREDADGIAVYEAAVWS
jgi:hypothetical protein